MPSRECQDLRETLVELLNEQLRILEKDTNGGVTEEELGEYEDREDCIRRLYDELVRESTVA
jgi:hypothetical protein